MASVNVIILVGNVTRTPDIKDTTSGGAVAKFTLAVNGYKKGDVDYFDVVAFDKLADLVSGYVAKGEPLYVQGRAKIESYEDKDGNKRKKFSVIAERIQLIGARPATNADVDEEEEEVPKSRSSTTRPASSTSRPAVRTSRKAASTSDDDEIPY